MELQKRLPSDRVSGTISFYISSDFQSDGSEVIVPPQVSYHSTHPSLMPSMSQDSCFSIEEDHTPLMTLHANTSQDTQIQADDIIPVVIAAEPEAADPSTAPSFLRQVSEPLQPNMVRQVLCGRSHLDTKDHTPLSRHHSLFDRSHNTHSSSHGGADTVILGEQLRVDGASPKPLDGAN
jgi:hypothetical protein